MITVAGKVRDIMGIGDDVSLEDEQINSLIELAEDSVKRDVFSFHYRETAGANPDDGKTWDGANTRFQISHPIMDSDFDQSVTDDVTGHWIDTDYEIQTLSVSVHNARYGLIDVYQSDGSTPIPSTAEDVCVDYYTSDEEIPFAVLENMGTLLCAHYVKVRITEPAKITSADIEGNLQVINIYKNEYMRQYRDLVNKYRKPLLRVT